MKERLHTLQQQALVALRQFLNLMGQRHQLPAPVRQPSS